jgi:hypothetical protein
MMADTIFDIESLMGDLTDEEADTIFKPANRRAPNFAIYQTLVNAQQLGQRKYVNIPKDHADPIEAARDLRYNLNEAAKERTVWKTAELTEDEAAQFATNKKIDLFERADGSHVTRIKGEWRVEVKEPVILRWKIDSKEEEREVTENGTTVKKTVKVPTRMYYVSVATTAVRHRAPRAPKPDESKPDSTSSEGETQAELPNANGVTEEVPAAV